MAEELRIVLRNAGRIHPESVEDYIAAGGYEGLSKARAMEPKELRAYVKGANLRGRGGAGFNAGMKWGFVPDTEGPTYVVCNMDEGEPGTYKDRVIAQNDPHSIFEGMAICGHAIRSKQGFLYCRGEYPFVVEQLRAAAAQAKDKGLLGDFDIQVRMGGGAYVVGEESAMIESIEGHRGEPRFKPPFPGVKGLWGEPTVVHNVETLANLPVIMTRGPEWFAAIGAPTYPGTKVFTLTGDVANRVVLELPTNVTLREIIYGFGGGVPGGKRLKAVQVGGTSGGILPESLLDTQVDFDSMRNVGATLGTGAVFVMDDTRDIVDVVTRISKFFEHESCGKCTPCREGSFRSHELMKRINAGLGTNADVDKLLKISRVMTKASFCGGGQAAPGPLVTAMQHFRPEFDRKLASSGKVDC